MARSPTKMLRAPLNVQRWLPGLVFFRNGAEILPNDTPYRVTISNQKSGVSFGRIQNDAGQNFKQASLGRQALERILQTFIDQPGKLPAGVTLTAADVSHILEIASQRQPGSFWGPNGYQKPDDKSNPYLAPQGTTGQQLGFASKADFVNKLDSLLNTDVGRYFVDYYDGLRIDYVFSKIDNLLSPLLNSTYEAKLHGKPGNAGILIENSAAGREAYFIIAAVYNRTENKGFLKDIVEAGRNKPVTLDDVKNIARHYSLDSEIVKYEQAAANTPYQAMGWFRTPDGKWTYRLAGPLNAGTVEPFLRHMSYDPNTSNTVISPNRYDDGQYHLTRAGTDLGPVTDGAVFQAMLEDPNTTFGTVNGVPYAQASNGVTFFVPRTSNGGVGLTQTPPPGGAVGDIAQIGLVFGSLIGRELGGSNLVLGVAAGSIISAVAFNIGQQIQAGVTGGYYGTVKGDLAYLASGKNAGSVWDDFGGDIAKIGKDAAIGAVSSYLTLELGQAIGLKGFGQGLFSAGVGGLLSHVVSNAVSNSSNLFAGLSAVKGVSETGELVNASFAASQLGSVLESSFAGFFGQKLAELVITPQTTVQALFATAGATALSVFADVAIGKALGFAGAAAGPVGVLVGTFVGFVVGALFGSLFGHRKPRIPSASAETVLQIPFARYGIGNEVSSNGGDLALADAMAKSARDTLNGLIDLITRGEQGYVSNAFSPTQTYGVTGNQIYVKLGGGGAINVTSADQAVDKGVMWALPQTQIIGGDIILKRALSASNAVDIAGILGDLQIAADYEQYLKAAPVIDRQLVQSWDNMSAGDQAFYTANKSFITRFLSRADVALSGSDQNFYASNAAQIDRIAAAVKLTSSEAGWIVTLARAGELGLNRFMASDFYGGLQGFLQSFGVRSAGSNLHYEDITASLSGGALTLTANGDFGAHTFSLLPSSSATGSSVTIQSFGAQVGYVEQYVGNRSSGSDIEIAASGSGAVTVYAGSSGYNGNPYYYSPSNDGGSDIIIGAGGNDHLEAGSGGDWIDGQGGDDTIYGGAGADVLLGGDGNDQIIGGTGREYLAGGTGNDYLDGGAGADVLVGGAGSDTLHGGNGNDTLLIDEDGGGTYDLLDGGNGSDTVSFERFSTGVTANISGQGPSNVLTVQQAGFTLYRNQAIYSPDGRYRFIFQDDQNLVLYGPGNAVLWASNTRKSKSDRVTLGADGNFVMSRYNGSVQWQSYTGGHSGATLTFDNAGQININDQDGTAYWTRGGGGYIAPAISNIYGDEWQSIENITGSNYDDHLTGTNYGSVLKGLDGNDVLTGGAGDDIIEGGSGADSINGGGGSNTASFARSEAGVYVSLTSGDAIGGDATGDTYVNIQNLSGSNFADEFAGDGNANIIKAGRGDDWIDATAGADTYDGGDGFDTVDYAGTSFVSGSGEVTEYDYDGYPYTYTTTIPALSVSITTYGGYVTYRNADGSTGYQTLQSIEQVIGTASDDSFSSSGTTINITWNGGAGADSFSGGDGSDTYVFGHGFGTYSISDTTAASNTLQMTSDVSFDDLWVGKSYGSLQVGIRGESGYMSINGNFSSGNNVIKTLDIGGAGHVDITQISAVYAGSDGAEAIYADSNTSNLIFAYNGNDTIYAANNAWSYQGSVIYAGLGNDTIVTSVGDDQFLFERGNGQDYVTDAGGRNTIVFGSTVAADDVIYQVVGNDLFIGIKDLDNSGLAASQVTDRIQIVGGAVKNVGTTYGTTSWNTEFSVEAGGATTDLTKANIAWVVNYYDDSYQGGGGGGYGYGGGYIPPIVLDLGNDGLQITPVAESDIVTKDAAGNVLQTSWVGPTNGILAFDRNGDGRVDNTADISFRQDKKGAKTDLEGLAGWDSNGDGVLNALDSGFAKLVVWTDANQDGQQEAGEVVSLLAAGVTEIDLKGKPTGFDGRDTIDTVVRNTTRFTRSDGSTGMAYDVSLARRALGDGAVSTILGAKGLGGVASIGRLASTTLATNGQKVSNAALLSGFFNELTDVETSGSVKSVIDPASASRWANALDPDLKAARKALLERGMQGADLLAGIRASKAHGDDWYSLFGRGLRTTATRMQAIVIDFNRSGSDFIDPKASQTLVDVSHTGAPVQVGWLKSSDGILVYDEDGNGQVDTSDEVDFTGRVANSRNAFQGLTAFDTNKDGALSAADSAFAKFLIWRDRNGNGRSDAGEVQSLAQAGVAKFDLTTSSSRSAFGSASANEVLGVGKVIFTDGSSRATYDVALGFGDGDTSADPAPARTPVAKTSVIETLARTTMAAGANEAGSASSNVSGSMSPTGVGRSRGVGAGPNGDVVTADSTQTRSTEWWRDPNAVGTELAMLAAPQRSGDRELGANRSSVSNMPGDAAQLQRLLLLRQNMAAMPGNGGGTAAIWDRGGSEDRPIAASTTSGYAKVPAPSLYSTAA